MQHRQPRHAGLDPARQFSYGKQHLIQADCTEWFSAMPPESVHAVVTDPPYGLLEFMPEQQEKLRAGRGGVWRIPPSFDGAQRRALPRFTVLSADQRRQLMEFFLFWGSALLPVLRPGAHLFIASNPLLSPLLSYALEQAGFERRGEIVRLVRTFRGGDRPKGAEDKYRMVSTMPRSCWEPWELFRKPLACKTVSENLRVWGTGGLRRVSPQTPFLDVIPSSTTPDAERQIAQHPSLKPQHFLRQIVRAALPIGKGVILDPFAGSGSTLAAAEFCNVSGIGIERDPHYFDIAAEAIEPLSRLRTRATNPQRELPLL